MEFVYNILQNRAVYVWRRLCDDSAAFGRTGKKETMDHRRRADGLLFNRPGIIAVNVSTFIGYKLKGVSGAVAATAGMVAPSVVIIIAIANAVSFYMKNEYVAHAFAGIRIVVIALIFDVVLGMWKKGVGSWFQGIIFCLSLLALAWLSVSPVTVVLAAAVIGLLIRS